MWIGVPIRVIALICSAVGLGIPYWAEYEHRFTGLKFNYGIYQVCSDIIGCEYTAPTETMNAVRALESLGTLLLLISVVLAFVKQCSSTNRQALFKGAGGLAIAAAVLIFVGIIIFGVKKEKQYTDIRGSSEAKNYKFHAGFYISIVAGVLSIVAGSLFLIDKAIENLRRENEVLKAGGPVVAMKNADAVDHARGYQDPRIITSHTYSQPRSYYSQTGGYYVEANPYHQKKHYRMKDFAL